MTYERTEPQLFNGAEFSLKTFYKFPENRHGSFRRGVRVTEDKVMNFYPDWLLEFEDKDGNVVPAVVESKSGEDVWKTKNNPEHPTYAKALDLVKLSKASGIRAGVVFKDATGWCVVVGKDDVGSLVFSPAREYFTLDAKR